MEKAVMSKYEALEIKAVMSKYEALDIKEEEKMEEEKEMEMEEEEEEEEEEDVIEEEEEEMEEEEEEDNNPLLSINWAEEPFPPVWKRSIRECPQYMMGMICRFVERWDLEDEPDERPDSEFDLPPLPRGFEPDESDVNYHRTIKTFLEQVRKSRGYDLDVDAPWFLFSPFCVRTPYLENEDYLESVSAPINSAIATINTNAKPHGKCYELVKVEKLVYAMPPGPGVYLMTLTVNEAPLTPNNTTTLIKTIQAMVYWYGGPDYRLLEWRFKPDSP